MSSYKVKAWSWCADFCRKNHWNPHDSYFWDKATLEYRRENNIFEVGDYIVDTVSNQFFRIIEVNGCDLLIEQMFWVNSLYQRHATPAEIQAGKRLN